MRPLRRKETAIFERRLRGFAAAARWPIREQVQRAAQAVDRLGPERFFRDRRGPSDRTAGRRRAPVQGRGVRATPYPSARRSVGSCASRRCLARAPVGFGGAHRPRDSASQGGPRGLAAIRGGRRARPRGAPGRRTAAERRRSVTGGRAQHVHHRAGQPGWWIPQGTAPPELEAGAVGGAHPWNGVCAFRSPARGRRTTIAGR